MSLNKKTILFVAIFVASVFAISAAIVAFIAPDTFQKPYQAVFTSNGEFYVGQMYTLPFSSTITLKDVYTLQRSANESGEGVQLVPLSSSLWAPKKISFNKSQIIFSGEIGEASEVMTAIKQSQNVPTTQTPPPQTQPQTDNQNQTQ